MEIPVSQFLGKKIPGWDFSKKAFYHTLTTEVLQSSPLNFSAILAKHNLTKPKYIWVFVKILFEKHQKMVIFGQKFGHWPNTKS